MFKDSLSKFFKVDTLINNLTGYVETRVELLKIEVKEELAKNTSKAILYFLIGLLFAMFILFLSMAIALLISSHLGGFAGFLIVGSFYLLTGFILLIFRKKVFVKLEKRFLKMFRNKK